MILQDLKIAIVENEERDMCAIASALQQLNKFGSDKINKDNIFKIYIGSDEDLFKVIEKLKIFKPDILFVDLHLITSVEDGRGLIKNIINSNQDVLQYIPKYIISGEANIQQFTDTFQFAYLVTKPSVDNITGLDDEQCKKLAAEYYLLFDTQHKMTKTLPLLGDMYRTIIEKFDTDSMLTKIEHKIDVGEITNEQIIGTLQTQSNLLGKIQITTSDIKERTQLIEIITKATAKALPKITDNVKAKKLIEDWGKDNNLKNALGNEFPDLPKGLYEKMKIIVDTFKDEAKDDLVETIYNTGKEYIINYLDTEANVTDDDTKMIILTKYAALLTERIVSIKK